MREKDKVNLIIDQGKMTVIGTGAGNARALGGQDAEVKDPIELVPIISGPRGKAWPCDVASGLRKMKIRPEDDGTLCHWVVEAPWAHPIWHSYSILLLHLRPMPDNRPTKIYVDGATHEMHVYALDPDVGRTSLIQTGIPKRHWMSPCNFAAQFIEISDDLARDRISNIVQEICDGKLSPDTDWQRDWVARFNDKMIKPEWR